MTKSVKKNASKKASQTENSAPIADADPILIKKYPNRRLYNTSTSSYIVLDDIVALIKENMPFVVQDKKTGEDITRSILNQIIYEQEIKPNNYHFPLEVQKQLIAMYDDTYGAMVPDYLTESMKLFVSEKTRMSKAVESVVDRNARTMMEFSQNMARQNMDLFKKSWEIFGGMNNASADEDGTQPKTKPEADQTGERETELEEIQNQINALQKRLKSLK